MKKVQLVSPRAELRVLRSLCNKDPRISGTVLSMIDDTYFYSQTSLDLYHTIKEKFSESTNAPSLRLILDDPEVSEDAKDFLNSAKLEVESKEDAIKSVQLLNKYRRTRILYELTKTINSAFENDKINLDNLVTECATQLNIAQSSKSNANCFVHLGKNDNVKDLFADIINGEDNDDIIPTGFDIFDKQSGGFDRGALVTLGATSGSGKSTLATQLAINLAYNGYKVVIVPLEMSKKEMGNRILANIGNMELSKIRQHKLDDREKSLLFKRHRKWRKEVYAKKGRLTIFRPEEDLDIDEVYASVSALKCDVCIIDYISLLKGIDDENQWLRLGSIARKAKINAEINNRVNILLCQVNDEGKIRYAGAIKEHSHTSWVWTPSDEDKASGIVRIEQIKSRNANPFPFSLKFIWNKMKVESMEETSDLGVPNDPGEVDDVNLASDI